MKLSNGGRRCVLVVDDDAGLADNLKDILVDEGWDAHTATSCERGWRMAQEHKPDVALIDLRLPDGPGTELLSRLRKEAPQCVAIMMTAHADLDSAITALEQGAARYLQKPVRPLELIRFMEGVDANLRLAEQARQAEEALRESEERYRLLADNATDLISRHGPDGTYWYASPSAWSVVGIEASKLVGRKLQEFVALEDREMVEQGVAAIGQQVATQTLAYRVITSSSEPRWIESTIRALPSIQGEGALELIASSRDISERKAVQLQLIEARDAAECANRSKSEFLANMSHEIRTPMNAVIGMTDLVLDTQLTADQRDYLTMVRSSAGALLTLVNDLLDLSKIEAGKLDLDEVPVDLRAYVRDSVRSLGVQAQQKGLQIALELAHGLPQVVIADPIRLRQVFINLLGNAIKFTDRGGVTVRIDLGDTPSGADRCLLRVSVSDTGEGIPAEKMGLLFTTFGQLDGSMRRRHGGAGLGLVISKRIIERMGGRIWAESEVGRGSRFIFEIELTLGEPDEVLPASERDSKPDAAPSEVAYDASLSPLHVLLAEDSLTNQVLMRGLLNRRGHTTDVVCNGRDAVSARREGHYDVVLMDVQMPELDGFEAARLIRAFELEHRCARIPIIALTAHALAGDRDNCLRAGMDEHIAKPIDAKELYVTMARVVSAARAKAGTQEDGS